MAFPLKEIICKRHAGVISPNHAVPMINPWPNVPMRICLHKVNTEISLGRFPSPYFPLYKRHRLSATNSLYGHECFTFLSFPFLGLSFHICKNKRAQFWPLRSSAIVRLPGRYSQWLHCLQDKIQTTQRYISPSRSTHWLPFRFSRHSTLKLAL